MAQPSNTFSSYDAVGNREDLIDRIYSISPTETPFLTGVGRTKATATYHEWQTDSLAAAAANAVIEGDEATTDASAATTRLGNYTQIMDKVARTTGTQEAVNKAGRKSEMAHQLAKRSQELKRDLEFALVGVNNAKVAGDDSTAREMASVQSWIATNTDKSTGGTVAGVDPTGDGTDARTDGDQRAFTEDMLKTVVQGCWNEGGNPTVLMVGAHNKQVVSGFTGGATRFDKSEDKKLNAAIDVYVSDFGELKIVPNRFMRARDALVLDMSMWKVAYLRPFVTKDLARTGDSERKQILVEATLQASQEAASGIIADLTIS